MCVNNELSGNQDIGEIFEYIGYTSKDYSQTMIRFLYFIVRGYWTI